MLVVGSPAAVRAGQAVFLAGGNASVVDRLRPVLSSLSETVRQYETAPLAITAKLATNMLLLSEVIALAEAFAVGRSGVSRMTSCRTCSAPARSCRLG